MFPSKQAFFTQRDYKYEGLETPIHRLTHVLSSRSDSRLCIVAHVESICGANEQNGPAALILFIDLETFYFIVKLFFAGSIDEYEGNQKNRSHWRQFRQITPSLLRTRALTIVEVRNGRLANELRVARRKHARRALVETTDLSDRLP